MQLNYRKPPLSSTKSHLSETDVNSNINLTALWQLVHIALKCSLHTSFFIFNYQIGTAFKRIIKIKL